MKTLKTCLFVLVILLSFAGCNVAQTASQAVRDVHLPPSTLGSAEPQSYTLAYCWRSPDRDAFGEGRTDVTVSRGDGSQSNTITYPMKPTQSTVSLGCFGREQLLRIGTIGLAWRPAHDQLAMITGSLGPPGDSFYLVGVSDNLAVDLPKQTLWEHEKHFVDPITLAWSPNGDWLATLGIDPDTSSWQDVWLYNPDSNQAKRVTSTRESPVYVYQSAWSANEEYLAIGYGLNPTGIMISRLDNLSHIEISSRTHFTLREWPYSFLATVQRPDGTQELDPRVYLQYYFVQSSRPIWVDQDQHIIFIAPAATDRVALFVVNVDGTDLHELLPDLAGLVGLPTLAPDGQKLAFVRYPGWNMRDRAEIAVVDSNTNAITSLAVLPAPSNGDELYISGLDWTPDGKYLAFSSNHEGQSDIYVISADGQAWLNLTAQNDGDAVNPVWRP